MGVNAWGRSQGPIRPGAAVFAPYRYTILRNALARFENLQLVQRLALGVQPDRFLLESWIDQFVMNIALTRFESQFANRIPNLTQRQEMNRTCLGHHIFFDHEAAHVIRAEEHGQLADLQALRDPARLDIRKIT